MRPVTRVFFSAARAFAAVSNLLHYCGAATLRLADFKEGIRSSWQDFNRHDADVAAGLMPWEKDLVDRFIRSGDAVLVVGSGSGRDFIPLVERGCSVTGVEPAASALEIARRSVRDRQLPAAFVEGFFEDVPIAGQFDVVMFSYYSYGYIPESRRRIGVLRKAAAHLTTGGHILLSYPAMARPRPMIIRLARTAGVLSGSDWRLEPGDFVFRAADVYDYAHAFGPDEVETEATAAGLRLVYRRDFPDDPVVIALQV
jgi:SAM-dependent methyltransferase